MASALLVACASTKHSAPVEVRQTPTGKPAPVFGATSSTAANNAASVSKPPPGIENAGQPGYYSVKPGDTLIRIALDNGQSPKDLARWNALENPNRIEVGQVLRVTPPTAEGGAVAKPVSSAKVETRPLDAKPGAGTGAAVPDKPADSASATAVAELNWRWPSEAPLLASFDEKRMGIDFGGQAGDPVQAAADGRVMFVGDGPRGYGKLIIIKHQAGYLSAYAHNQKLLVEDGSAVRQGQKIAEMGSTDTDRVKLHFEIRKDGKPVDPTLMLPPR